jgi:hypothetical protein
MFTIINYDITPRTLPTVFPAPLDAGGYLILDISLGRKICLDT